MKSFFTVVYSDYLQRTRSYAFLITLCISIAIAYTFVPEPNANYSTIRIADHVGYYNSAWFGYVTAIMTSIFLSLFGYYLVNSGIKKDIETKVGHIIASTSISNISYLFAKALSNFLLLISIVGVVFTMSIVLFLLYNDGYPFEPIQFIEPYIFITIPAMFFIAIVAIVFEVLFGKYTILQQLGFFALFSVLMVFSPKTEAAFSLDVFGSKIVMHELEETVQTLIQSNENTDLSIGYIVGNVKKTEKFEFNGIDFPFHFILSRFFILLLGIGLIFLISPLFHRFNIKKRISRKKSKTDHIEQESKGKAIILSNLPIASTNYGIGMLIKIEFLILLRKGKKWLWLLNITGMVLLAVLPIHFSHQLVLPILWFLQVHRISDISTKEFTHNMQEFAFASYQPLQRLLGSQIFACIGLLVGLAMPLIIRLIITGNPIEAITVILGGIGVVLLSSVLGMLSKGKKLFEVFFFMLTYGNINGIPQLDYFGGYTHSNNYILILCLLLVILAAGSIFRRRHVLHK